MRVIAAILILVISAQSMTEEEVMIKRIIAEGRQVVSAKAFHQDKAEGYKKKMEEYEEKIKSNRKKLDSLYAKHNCRLKDNCSHKRDMKCYKMARTMKSLLAQIKKDTTIKEKYQKYYSNEDKKAKAKAKREQELRGMLAKYRRK